MYNTGLHCRVLRTIVAHHLQQQRVKECSIELTTRHQQRRQDNKTLRCGAKNEVKKLSPPILSTCLARLHEAYFLHALVPPPELTKPPRSAFFTFVPKKLRGCMSSPLQKQVMPLPSRENEVPVNVLSCYKIMAIYLELTQ